MYYEQKRTAQVLNTLFIIEHSVIICLFLLSKQFAFAAETAIALGFYIGFVLFEKIRGIQLENYLRLLVIMSALLNSFIAEYLRLYYSTEYFDKLLHTFGSFTFSLAIYSIVNKLITTGKLSKLFVFVMVVSLGALVGISMELMEFFSDTLFGTYNQFGVLDTNLDMAFDMFGAFLAAVFAIIGKQGILHGGV